MHRLTGWQIRTIVKCRRLFVTCGVAVTLQENIMDSRHHSKASVAIAAGLVALIGISAVWLLRVFWFHV